MSRRYELHEVIFVHKGEEIVCFSFEHHAPALFKTGERVLLQTDSGFLVATVVQRCVMLFQDAGSARSAVRYTITMTEHFDDIEEAIETAEKYNA